MSTRIARYDLFARSLSGKRFRLFLFLGFQNLSHLSYATLSSCRNPILQILGVGVDKVRDSTSS